MEHLRNRNGRLRSYVAVAVLVMAVGSCGVKDDRDSCPCRLTVDFTDLSCKDKGELFFAVEGEDSGKLLLSSSADPDNLSSVIGYEVAESVFWLSCVASDGGMADPLGNVIVPVGMECPEFYSFHRRYDAGISGEVESHVFLNKDHCVMHVSFLSGHAGSVESVVVKGEVNGMTSHGKPSAGRYVVNVDAASREFDVVLPRQTADSALSLELFDGDGLLKVFPLGEKIREGGYDWTEPDLSDLEVGLDFVSNRLVIEYDLWGQEHEFEAVL